MNIRNNQLFNLRPATNSQNQMNRNATINSKTGIKGVSYDKTRGKYVAQITTNGKGTNLGRYYTAKEASEVREQASLKYHGEFAR